MIMYGAFKVLLIACFATFALYHFYAAKIKHRVDPRVRFSKVAVWNKVDELRREGVREAKTAYFFWVLANILLAVMFGIFCLNIGRR